MEQIRTITREFATGDAAVLHLESRSGEVTVHGREGAAVSVTAVVHVWSDMASEADDYAAMVERNMEQDGHRVIIRAPSHQREGWSGVFGNSPRVDYAISVPVRTAVRVLSRSGAVVISHIEGVVHSEALSGKIAIDDVVGAITVVSRSGNVLIERIDGAVSAEARSGRLRLRDVTGAAQLDARSGGIEVERVAGDTKLAARSGSVAVEDAGARLHVRAHAGSVRYKGRVCGDMDIEANAGSITFAVDPETPFFIEAESVVGTVRNELPERRGGGPPAQGGPRVRLRTRAGSIRLVRA